MTHAQFKKVQLDHLVDVILEAGGDDDHAARRIADEYPTDNIQVLSNHDTHDTTSIRKQKSVGTRKHNSEAVVKTNHEHVAKDSEGSTKDVSMKIIQETTLHTTGGGKRSIGCDDTEKRRRGNMSDAVQP